MDQIIIFCAQYLVFLVILAAGIYWLTLARRQKVSFMVFGLIAGITAYLLAKVGGTLFDNPRPFVNNNVVPLFTHAADNGFPSDHTLFTAVIAATVWSFSKKWGVVFFAFCIIVGGSRVLAHVHHVIDIVGAIGFAVLGAAVAYAATKKLLHAKTNRLHGTTKNSTHHL